MLERIKKLMTRFKSFDQRLCLHIFKWGGKRFRDRLMYLFSHIGYGYLYPVMLVLVYFLGRDQARILLPAGLLAFGIETTGHTVIKVKAGRKRPFESLPGIVRRMSAPDRFSFPSGHAAGACIMATLCMHAYPAMALPSIAFAGTVGLSRIYMGMHYPSDVMVGSVLGILSARLGLAIML
ncbi:phosphatase PAP2 family protein [bacterium]|nr:phosphatase PAP2 family protein [bacterium]